MRLLGYIIIPNDKEKKTETGVNHYFSVSENVAFGVIGQSG